jgi:hypothetical protein
MSSIVSNAPHQPRKKRKLTRAIELLKYKYGGERVCLTIVFRSPINNTNYPLQPSNGKLFNI